MKSFLKRMRQKVENDLINSNRWKYFSPAIYAQFKIVLPILIQSCHGNLLDIGCGRQPYRPYLLANVTNYDGVDLFSSQPGIKYRLDAQNLEGINSQQYDTAIMIEVLEHLPQPWNAVSEAYRILKPDGKLVVSVPHLSRLHDLPHDYYRFTANGLHNLLQDAGFEEIHVIPKGGLLSFIGHQISSFMIPLTWGIPVLKHIVFFLNKWLVTIFFYNLDSLFKIESILPLGYAAIGHKKNELE